MIQIPQTTLPVSGYAPNDANDLTEAANPASDLPETGGAAAGEPTQGGDPLARFGSMPGMHAGVQQFAYAAPGGGGGGSTPDKATAKSAPAKGDAPITATGIAGAQQWMDRGNAALKAKDYAKALECFQEGFRTYPDAKFILNEAAALLDSGRYAEAVLTYERYLSDPDAPRQDEARAAMDRAREKMGGREATATGVAASGPLFEKGEQAYKAGRYEEALEAFEQSFEANPLAATSFNAAACLEKLGRRYAAADRYTSYLVMDPHAKDFAQVNARITKLRAEADTAPITATGAGGGQEWMTRGVRLLQDHRYDEAAAAFREGFRTYPDAKFILNEAAALLDGGRYADADRAYDRYLSDPDAARADEARAAQQRARAQMGGHEASLARTEEAGRQFDKATALYKAGRYADALEAFDRAYELNPMPEIRYNQGACLDKMGHREAAAQRYDDYVNTMPHAPDAAKVHTRATKLHTEATNFARDAFDRGQAAYSEGRFRDAATAFGEAYEHLPLPQFLYNKGAALDLAGETAKAVREYQLYLNAAPGAPDAGKVRDRIHELQKVTGTDLIAP